MIPHLRALAGAALEQQDLAAAEQLTEQALAISEQGRQSLKFLVLLDRAGIWAARGQVRDALVTVHAARAVLPATTSGGGDGLPSISSVMQSSTILISWITRPPRPLSCT